MTNKLNTSEAIFGFVMFLTMQQEEMSIGGGWDYTDIASKVEKFCVANNLARPGEDWVKKVIFPS